jgi:hypothetical protein
MMIANQVQVGTEPAKQNNLSKKRKKSEPIAIHRNYMIYKTGPFKVGKGEEKYYFHVRKLHGFGIVKRVAFKVGLQFESRALFKTICFIDNHEE